MRENCTYGLKRGKESKGCILPSAFFFYSTGACVAVIEHTSIFLAVVGHLAPVEVIIQVITCEGSAQCERSDGCIFH